MIVCGRDILQKKYIVNGDDSNIANATYNLTVGAIIYRESEEYSIHLQPGEVVCVISKEVFGGRKDNSTALVNLKSSLTKAGILALDTGYVDPTYEGPIGTILVNFSKNPVPIHKGDQFFRVMFFEHASIPPELLYKPTIFNSDNHKKALQDYIKTQKRVLASNFTGHFLNTEKLRGEIENEVVGKVERKVYEGATLKFISHNFGAFMLLLMAMAFLLLFGLDIFASKISRNLVDKNSIESEIFIQRVIDGLDESESFNEKILQMNESKKNNKNTQNQRK